ncbi:DUF2931 family protein [Kaistella jeonii]|uniref:DUF2931 family protein n=1 Tax=Kaistella jeonii TaxID=266749 RepID=A0A0C1CPN1_9FLAO|nr:DUF2931 family protein [Kaistella jeonii]KIA86041.1 hypothetical protein OA86_14115 [Kaistella jeonii]SFC36101.1 Protein of unknown function [Kaistella jeonii]VEI97316.1 Protein of uncharacterised function (DUF2931) [Kaistella jeonii]
MKRSTIITLLLFLFLACQEKNIIKKDNFSYSVTVSAPEEYPVEVHEGWLLDKDRKMICGIPKAGMAKGGFQFDGAAAAQGGFSIPYHINLTYVAYAEKKFYSVEADLPADKIRAAFQKGFLVEKVMSGSEKIDLVHSTYDKFTVALAPGGVVVVFLGGSSRTEICRLQAKEIFVDRNDFYDNPHERTQQGFFDELFRISVSDSIKTQIEQNGIPYGLWDQYLKKYNYRFTFQPYDDNDVIVTETDHYYNGEVTTFLQPEEIAKKEYKNLSIPYNIKFYFKKYFTEIEFNDTEMFNVFDELQSKHPGKPMDILVVPTFMYNDFKLSVKCEDEIVPLTNFKVKGIWGG